MIIADEEFCVDCGESATCMRWGVLLCESCARDDIDDVNEFEDDREADARAGSFRG